MPVKGVAQISILDLNDAILSGDPPSNPVNGTLWIDSSVTPNVLKSWNETLRIWEEQTLDLGGLDPDASQDIDDLLAFANKAASDGYLAETEKLNIKILLVQMTGDTLTDRTMPTLTEIDAIKGGEVYTVRSEAIAAGVPSSHANYVGFEDAYDDLRIYFDGLDPRPWEAGDTVIDSTQWPVYWDAYYEYLAKLRVTTTQYQIDAPKNTDGENQWQARKYTKALASSSTIPAYADIDGLTPTTTTVINDVNTSLLAAAGFSGDNFIAVFTTNVYMNQAKSISFTLASDDTSNFYVNGTSAATSNNNSTSASVALKAGWNKIELFYYEHSGAESVSINSKLSSLVDKMAYRLGGGPTLFNGVTIDTSEGVVATRSDNKVKASLNATTGIKIQRRAQATDLWSDAFYADTNGVINANGLVIDASTTLNGTRADTLVNTANSKAKTFTSTPTVPYNVGDIYKNGQTTYIATVARASNGTYTAADWVLSGDVTNLNTSYDTARVNNVTASTISGAVANFNNNNDRKSTTPATPTSPSLSSSINLDGSADLVLTWTFTGTGDAYDIDGFLITVYAGSTNAAYTIGTTTSSEDVSYTAPDSRAVILRGYASNKYYTVGVKAYRVVDTDINSAGIIKGSNTQNAAPHQPSSTVNLGGSNGVKIDSTNGLVATTASGTYRTKTTLNATDGIKIEKSSDSGSTFPTKVFYADANGNLVLQGDITANTGYIGGTGGFTIDTSKIYSGSKSTIGSINAGVYIGTDGLALGTGGNNNFQVTNAGVLTATNAAITGTITSNNATITGGSLTVGSNFSVSNTGVLTASNATITGTITSSNATITGGTLTVGSNFSVTNTGTLTASNATISGTITSNNATITGGSLTVGSNFSVTNTGVLTASGATISGAITADSGKIGGSSGFTITTNKFYSNGKTSYNDANTGVYVGTDGIGLGNAAFYVTSAGALTSTSATITGQINADTGRIGGTSGFTIGANKFYNGKTAYNDANNGVYIGTDGIGLGNAAFYVTNAGALTATSATITGTITANSGKIGGASGFTITTNKMYSGSKTGYNDSNAGVYVGTDGIGLGASKFYIDSDGNLTATSATISGALTAGAGSSINGSYITTSTITWDKAKGGTLALGGELEGNGVLQVYDATGDEVANINSAQAGFDVLRSGSFSSPDVANYNEETLNFYVDPAGDDGNNGLSAGAAGAKRTIQAAINIIPKFNNGTVVINCKAPSPSTRQDYWGNVSFNGFQGSGQITLEGNDWYNYINGQIVTDGCTNEIRINNFTLNYTGVTNGSVLIAYCCSWVELTKIWVYGVSKASSAFFANYGTRMKVNQCEGYDCSTIVNAQNLSMIAVNACKGLGTSYGMVGQWGGWIYCNGSLPGGPSASAHTYQDSGGGFTGWASTAVNTGAKTNPVPTATSTATINSTSGDNWSPLYNSWQGSADGVKQGNYGYGNRTGAWFFGTSILDTIGTGKTIKAIRLYVTRMGKGGSSSAQRMSVRAHSSATKPAGNVSVSSEIGAISLAWGQSGWLTINSTAWTSFANGTYRGFGIYTADGSNYSMMSTVAKVEITYQ